MNEIKRPGVNRSDSESVSAQEFEEVSEEGTVLPQGPKLKARANFILILKGQDDLS